MDFVFLSQFTHLDFSANVNMSVFIVNWSPARTMQTLGVIPPHATGKIVKT